jgi:diacylglycerol O-acyltransferase
VGARDALYPVHMKRLSGLDAAFLFAETRACPTHGGSLRICDPSAAPNFGFGAVRDVLIARLPELPPLRCRVAGARLGLDRPWLVEDPNVDIDFHLRRIMVPSPGGRRELDELVGRLMSYPLDRGRPLWQAWFIEGLEHGRVAIFTKVHHALADGVSGANLTDLMYDASRQPRPRGVQADQSSDGPAIPRFWRRALEAIFNVAVMTPYRMLRVVQQTLSQQLAVRGLANKPPHFFQAPTTRFNGPISPRRRFTSSRLPLDRLNNVKRAFGVKLNDVVLAVVSGAMRRYLQDRGELPERSLVAQMPISTRRDSTVEGNQITSMSIALATDVADPAQRIKTIFANTQGAKEMAEVLARHQITELTGMAPPRLLALGVRAYTATHLGSHFAPINMVISNICGPDTPRFVAGAVVEQLVPVGLLMLDVGLNVFCYSHIGWANVGFLTTPEMANDIDELADAIEPALQELEDAASLVASS